MAAVALALLLAASLDAASASLDAAGARALFGRLARGPKGAVRRLSDDDDAPFMGNVSEECKAECTGLDDWIAAVNETETEMEESPEESEEKWSGSLAMVGLLCDHKTAIQCFADAEECAASKEVEEVETLATVLTCVCDTCSGADVALAKYIHFGNSGDDEGQDGQDGQEGQRRMSGAPETTTEGIMAETTIEEGGDENDEKAMTCAMYEMALCVEEYPTECSALDDWLNITQGTEGDMGELEEMWQAPLPFEEMCTGDFAPGAGGDDHNDTDGDGDGDGDGNDDDDDAGDVVSGCGPVGLGWLVASVPTVMAALQLVAA